MCVCVWEGVGVGLCMKKCEKGGFKGLAPMECYTFTFLLGKNYTLILKQFK